jgi:hypothetical protein
MTLKSGVELTIKKHLPQIESVTSIDPSWDESKYKYSVNRQRRKST